MKEKDLKHRLQQTFDLSIWKEILPLFFKKIDYFSHPENVFSNDEKVIDGKQIGTVKLDDGKQLAIFTVEVADSISIVRNRQGLREIAAKHIDQNIIHGALAFFYNKNQVDYRFSFIAKEASLDLETGELIKGETKPKRYTYLLGGNEACTTPAKRMLVLAEKREKGEVNIKELKEVFSVEALNKDFFKSYKAHYEKFAKHLADENNPFRAKLIDTEKETKDKEEKPIRDFVKKLLGRIVFLQFLEKKGWMGCDANTLDWTGGNPRFMYQLFEDFSKPEKFHSQCLTKLFFETLNTKRPNDIFEVKGLNGKLNGSRVPYLNGGLFEPEKNKSTLDIDFPADFFKELLEFFDQYNFTIDENSPDDHEVGIDPEMLGHIFENLLEDNRDKGAFYTPKEIVQYMCKESLIQYLLNTFQEQKDIEAFIRFHSVSPFLAEKENALLLNQKLDDIKVCDPAIGSGAFPIGMLQEIFEAKRFIYPYLKTNQDFKPAEVKKNIIQNSIYGVDLEKGAVDIAQLRFWLSLVVDELNPHPLPNLDYKIMQGNSLLEQYEGIELGNAALFNEPEVKIYQASMFEEPKPEYGFSKEKQADIKSLIDDYFKVEDKERKTSIHKRIDNIVIDHIDKSLEFFENKLLIEIATYEKQLDKKLERLTESQKQQVLSKSKELKEIEKRKKQLDSKSAARKRLLEFEKTDERPYFLWHLYFMDVFEQGGFDVMIGNPPYIQLQKMGKETDILQEAGFETFARTGDIYCLFYELGNLVLKKKGVLCYITNASWMRTLYGKSLREFFINKVNPIKLIDLSDSDIFHSAVVLTNIMLYKNELFKNDLQGLRMTKKQTAALKNHSNYINSSEFIKLSDLSSSSWTINDIDSYKIVEQVNQKGRILVEWNLRINIGILNGLNEAFVIDENIRNEIIEAEPKAKEIIFPMLRGRDMKRYYPNFSKLYLINTYNGELVEKKDEHGKSHKIRVNRVDVVNDYPVVYSHLKKFEEKAKIRFNQGDHWTNLRNCAYNEDFLNPKIIYPSITKDLPFIYDENCFFTNDKSFIMSGEKLKYLTVFFNSSLFRFCYENKFPELQGNSREIKKNILEMLPVYYLDNSILNDKFNIVCDYLIFLYNPSNGFFKTRAINDVIELFDKLSNMMVYELYFEEEMKAKEIDVLQFVTEKAFPDITQAEDPKAIIQKVYYELQQKDNPIRNRILVASSRSETIARINAATS